MAVARPMPVLLPVTMTTLPSRSRVEIMLGVGLRCRCHW